MVKGGGSSDRGEGKVRKMGGGGSFQNKRKMKKNMQRLGGNGGLSLESFANAKTRNDKYNPALIKKQKEFYKNAKYIQKYKRSLKHQQQQQPIPSAAYKNPFEVDKETEEHDDNANHQKKRSRKKGVSLNDVYNKKREEEEKARMEREAMIQAKKEQREQSEARRKALKEKMCKKTKFGQPVMKYRIEHLLETIINKSAS